MISRLSYALAAGAYARATTLGCRARCQRTASQKLAYKIASLTTIRVAALLSTGTALPVRHLGGGCRSGNDLDPAITFDDSAGGGRCSGSADFEVGGTA